MWRKYTQLKGLARKPNNGLCMFNSHEAIIC
jgi:hypothetical protein